MTLKIIAFWTQNGWKETKKMKDIGLSHQVSPVEVCVHVDLRLLPPETPE